MNLVFIGVDHPHGAHWRQLLRNLPDDLKLSAVVPYYEGATASLEEAYAELPRFPDVSRLLAEHSFDAAIVCLPNRDSAAVLQLADAGKHLLCEKPVAGAPDDLANLAELCRHRGVAFQSGYMWRYDRIAERLRRMIADAQFGKLISIEMGFFTSDVKRRDPEHYLFDAGTSTRGFFNWLACHFLDLLFYVTQAQVVGVTARVGRFGGFATEVEDGGSVILDLSNGALVTFTGGYWLPRWAGESWWAIRGSERWVHWDPARAGTGGALEIHGPKPQWHAMEETFCLPPDDTPGYGGARGIALLQDWLAVIRGERPACRNTPESTLATLQLLETIYQSSAEQRRIECAIGSRHEG